MKLFGTDLVVPTFSISGSAQKSISRKPSLVAGFLVLLISAGCSQSKEDKALERIANRKAPSYLRLVNFSSKPASLLVKGRVSAPNVAPQASSVFGIAASGKEKISVKSDDKSVFESDIELAPGAATTVLLTDKGGKLIEGNQRNAEAGKSSVRAIDASGEEIASVQADGQDLFSKLPPESGSETKPIAEGHHSFTIKTSSGKQVQVEGEFKAGDCYSILINVGSAGATASIVGNSPIRKPNAGGMSSAG